jgi:hypothetical protein
MFMLAAFVKNSQLCARYAPRSGYSVLNSKRGNKNFYKGNRVPSIGRHTKTGARQAKPRKNPEYMRMNFIVCVVTHM